MQNSEKLESPRSQVQKLLPWDSDREAGFDLSGGLKYRMLVWAVSMSWWHSACFVPCTLNKKS